MRALVIHAKNDMREDDVETPTPGPDQVRVRLAYAGICGSDLHYYFDGANGAFELREPLIPGHELTGTIDLDPSGTIPEGTPVTIHPATFGVSEAGLEERPNLWPHGGYLGSASTWPHTQGGMSEYLVVSRSMIRALPVGLPLRRATLAEPLAVGLHALRLAGPVAGKRILISGAGPIGLLATAAALAHGAAEVVATDVLRGPLARARDLGAHSVVRAGEEALPENHFDVVLECAGVPAALSAAIAAAKRAGVVVQVGMLAAHAQPISLAPLVSKEITLLGSFRFTDEMQEAIDLLTANPAIEQVITHEYSASRAVEAFQTALESERSGKVVVNLWPREGL